MRSARLLLATLLILGTGIVADAQAASNPGLESIDFKNNISVKIDHQHSVKGENPIAIKEYGESNEVEWQVAAPGKTKKWPVVYVRQSVIKLVAQFSVNTETRELLEKGLEGNVALVGEGTVSGTAITFRKELTLGEVSTQLAGHPQYLTTGEITAKAALPNKVIYELATIKWKWTGKEKGAAGPFEREIGKSTHNFYLTYAQPRATSKITNYLTLLDLDTQGIEKVGVQPPSEAQVINGIWSEFKTRNIGVRWYGIETGSLNRGGFILQYYQNEGTVGETLKQIVEGGSPSCPLEGVGGLLSKGQGQCGAWAQVLSYALAIEGISSAIIEVAPNVGTNLLVKKWEFVGKGNGEAFPYKAQEIKDLSGAEGQGTQNPPALFSRHYIDEVPLSANVLYDPSYGTGTFEGAERIKKYQNESIDGFCEPFVANESKCVKATVGAEQLNTAKAEEYK